MAGRFGDDFRLTLMTNDARLAAEADGAGVDRIGVDLEHIGKAQRQAGHDLRLSLHTLDDLARLSAVVRRGQLFARVNSLNAGSAAEIDLVLALGAQVLMLPYFADAAEAASFVALVRGRAVVQLLVETEASARNIHDVAAVRGVDEIMVGLNDLRLQLKAPNHFEVMLSPLVEAVAAAVRRRGLPFSIGGVGRVETTGLPVPPDLVLAQYPRLGATGALLARSFFSVDGAGFDFAAAIAALRRRLDTWAVATPKALASARAELARHASNWHPAVAKS